MGGWDFNTAGAAAVEQLVRYVTKGECVLFLGAGVHAPPPAECPFSYPPEKRVPMASALAELLAAECKFKEQLPDEPCNNLQRVSLCFETTAGLGRKELVARLKTYLRKGKEPSPALRMLASLPFRIIVTTNFDRLLETALQEPQLGKEPVVFVYDPLGEEPTPDMIDDPTPETPMIFKMHGDLDREETIVITDEDYIRFVQRMGDKEALHPIPETIRYRMQKWPTLFVGYSLRDYNLRLLFRTLRWHLDKAKVPPSYSVDRDPDKLIFKVWQVDTKVVTFVTQDIWKFVPFLYEQVLGKEYADASGAHAGTH